MSGPPSGERPLDGYVDPKYPSPNGPNDAPVIIYGYVVLLTHLVPFRPTLTPPGMRLVIFPPSPSQSSALSSTPARSSYTYSACTRRDYTPFQSSA